MVFFCGIVPSVFSCSNTLQAIVKEHGQCSQISLDSLLLFCTILFLVHGCHHLGLLHEQFLIFVQSGVKLMWP